MITGIRDFYYNVQDMDRAVKFYTQVLPFKYVAGDEYWTTLNLNGMMVGLHGSEGEAVPPLSFDGHGAHHGGTMTLQSDNVAEDKKKLEDAGVKILSETVQPWGHIVVFQDPDGNILKIMK
jgi:predicted enzyme related to lactoylglutathione lyase